MTADEFTSKVAGELRKKMTGARVTVVEPLTIELSLEDKREVTVRLDKYWFPCERGEVSCDEAIGSYVTDFVEAMDDNMASVTPDSLRVVLRPQSYVEESRKRMREHGQPDDLGSLWLGDLWIMLVHDMTKTTRLVIESDLNALKLGRDEAMEIARRNTARAMADDPPQKDGKARMFSGDPYESSRLVVGTDWAAIARTVEGELLVAAPARDLVLFAGSKELKSAEFQNLVRSRMNESDLPLSDTILRWTSKGFQAASP